MKRALIITVCFSILYAGAAWAFTGCENLIATAAGHEHGHGNAGHHHDGNSAPQHGESEKIHCPDLSFGFLAGIRSSLEAKPRAASAVDYQSFDVIWPSLHAPFPRFDLGPPGPSVSQSRSLHLLLSVIRI